MEHRNKKFRLKGYSLVCGSCKKEKNNMKKISVHHILIEKYFDLLV